MKKILVGNTGFVGSNLSEQIEFDQSFNSKNIEKAYGLNPDLLYYAGVPAQKFIADKNPKQDFEIIESAINKAKSKGSDENYEAVRYEGYAPNGIAVMIDCLTDNKNRTAGFVRSTLTKRGGNLGTDGSVSYLFERKGVIVLDKVYDEDKIMEDVLNLDILDFVSDEDSYTVYTEPNNFIKVKDSLTDMGYDNFIMSEVTFVPNNYITLEEEEAEKVVSLIDALNDLDDVQSVYHNLDL